MLTIFKRLPIRLKFVTATTLILLLISLFIFTYYPARERKQTLHILEEKVQGVAEMIALATGIGLESDDMAPIHEALNSVKGDSSLIYVILLDLQNSVIAAFNPSDLNVATGELFKTVGVVEQEGRLAMAKPIRYRNREYGTVVLAFSLDRVERSIVTHRVGTLYFIGVMMGLGVFIAMFFGDRITRPIIKLRNAAKEVALGDFDVKIEIENDDEIGDPT